MTNIKKRPLRFILIFYFGCFLFRGIEYLLLRTDQSITGEAFIHKIIGIGLLAAAVRFLQYNWSDIGFRAERAVMGLCCGLLFGSMVYALAYGIEMLVQVLSGNSPSLQFYVTSYAVQGNRTMQNGAIFILICIIGNIINVIMEEGVFRGLFIRLAEEKYSFGKACALASLLFGLWHIAQPVRNLLDGNQSLPGAVMMSVMLIVTSAMVGVQYAMLFKISGDLWVGMAAHFVNNTIVNLLHVAAVSGVDELQTIRISIAQALSFIMVAIMFLLRYRKKQLPENIRRTV